MLGRSQANDEVMHFRVPFDICPDVWAGHDHTQVPPASVIERELRKQLADALSPVRGQHLGVDERDTIPPHDVVEEACEVGPKARFVPSRGLGIDDRRSHAPDGTG
jgi:hypothetical protein